MNKVWKFPLLHDTNLIGVPVPWRIVHVGVDPQGDPNMPCVWIQVAADPNARGQQINLRFYGTGHLIDEGTHVGSVVCASGLVWHVYVS